MKITDVLTIIDKGVSKAEVYGGWIFGKTTVNNYEMQVHVAVDDPDNPNEKFIKLVQDHIEYLSNSREEIIQVIVKYLFEEYNSNDTWNGGKQLSQKEFEDILSKSSECRRLDITKDGSGYVRYTDADLFLGFDIRLNFSKLGEFTSGEAEG